MITNPIQFVFYVGDGINTDFSFAFNGTVGFDTRNASEVKAFILYPDGHEDRNPAFQVLQDTSGNLSGRIRFIDEAPVDGAVVFIFRETDQTQEISLKTASGFSAKDIEYALDKLTKMIQELDLHARQKVIQLDVFQQEIFKVVLIDATMNNRLLHINWDPPEIRQTEFTIDDVQLVIDNAVRSARRTVTNLERRTDGSVEITFEAGEGTTRGVTSGNVAQLRFISQLNPDGIRVMNLTWSPDGENFYPAGLASLFTDHRFMSHTDSPNSHPASAISTPNSNVQLDLDTLNTLLQQLGIRMDTVEGKGGSVGYANLGRTFINPIINPNDIQDLLTYFIAHIWEGSHSIIFNTSNWSATTFIDVNGNNRTAAEIFNSTFMVNAYDNTQIQLVNTQNTTPAVFQFVNNGQTLVALATATVAGLVRGAGDIEVDLNGDMFINFDKAAEIRQRLGLNDPIGMPAGTQFWSQDQTLRTGEIRADIETQILLAESIPAIINKFKEYQADPTTGIPYISLQDWNTAFLASQGQGVLNWAWDEQDTGNVIAPFVPVGVGYNSAGGQAFSALMDAVPAITALFQANRTNAVPIFGLGAIANDGPNINNDQSANSASRTSFRFDSSLQRDGNNQSGTHGRDNTTEARGKQHRLIPKIVVAAGYNAATDEEWANFINGLNNIQTIRNLFTPDDLVEMRNIMFDLDWSAVVMGIYSAQNAVNGLYTAPADGVVFVLTWETSIQMNGFHIRNGSADPTWGGGPCYIPVKKGDQIRTRSIADGDARNVFVPYKNQQGKNITGIGFNFVGTFTDETDILNIAPMKNMFAILQADNTSPRIRYYVGFDTDGVTLVWKNGGIDINISGNYIVASQVETSFVDEWGNNCATYRKDTWANGDTDIWADGITRGNSYLGQYYKDRNDYIVQSGHTAANPDSNNSHPIQLFVPMRDNNYPIQVTSRNARQLNGQNTEAVNQMTRRMAAVCDREGFAVHPGQFQISSSQAVWDRNWEVRGKIAT